MLRGQQEVVRTEQVRRDGNADVHERGVRSLLGNESRLLPRYEIVQRNDAEYL
jgi:hypothetical protein